MARRDTQTTATTGLGLQPETLWRGALVGIVLLAALAGIAWLASDRAPASPLDSYRRMGGTAGAAALQRDLLAEFPPGTPAVPVVRRLEGMGFTCLPAGEGWRCGHAAPSEGRRLFRTEVTLDLAGGATTGIRARMFEDTR